MTIVTRHNNDNNNDRCCGGHRHSAGATGHGDSGGSELDKIAHLMAEG